MLASAAIASALAVAPAAAGCNSGNSPNTALLSESGCSAEALGISALAIGLLASAPNDIGVAIGFFAQARAKGAVAIGSVAGPDHAGGEAFVSIGSGSGGLGAGAYSTALGGEASAVGNYSVALGGGDRVNGNGAMANEAYGVAIGTGAVAIGVRSTAVGAFAGNGAAINSNRNSAFGEEAGQSVDGAGNTATGLASGNTVIGNLNTALGNSAGGLVTGNNNTTGGVLSGITVKGFSNAAYGDSAGRNVEGNGNVAIGHDSGRNVTANDSVAVGTSAIARKTGSVAIGRNAVASRPRSVAIGSGSVANQPDVVSVGSRRDRRRIINIGDGIDPHDAASVGQVQAMLAASAASGPVSGSAVVGNTVMPRARTTVGDRPTTGAPPAHGREISARDAGAPSNEPASSTAAGAPAHWGNLPRMPIERQFAGPLKDTVIQRRRDPTNGMVCYVYLPIEVAHSPPTAQGYVSYGGNIIGSISCVPDDRRDAPSE